MPYDLLYLLILSAAVPNVRGAALRMRGYKISHTAPDCRTILIIYPEGARYLTARYFAVTLLQEVPADLGKFLWDMVNITAVLADSNSKVIMNFSVSPHPHCVLIIVNAYGNTQASALIVACET